MLNKFLHDQTTRRLTLSYLAVIMIMSIGFSIAIYIIIASHLNRPLPEIFAPDISIQRLPDRFTERIMARDTETRMSVLGSLIILNIVVAIGGAILSYFLARRTLRPIEQSINSQTQFISDASHEIRTPLTALQTSNEVALRKQNITEDKARAVFKSTINEIEKLRSLADGLLDLVAIKPRDQTKTIDLNQFLSNVVQRIKLLAKAKDSTIIVKADSKNITANTVVLEQIMTIILDNAMKYSPENSTITINGKVQHNGFTIAIKDQGIGINKDDQAHIFDRFYRADSARTRTNSSGHGLGLAIAKKLADEYALQISCESKIGKGSTFTIHSS